MKKIPKKKPFFLERGPFTITCIILAVGFFLLAYLFYEIAKTSEQKEFLQKLGEHMLQISVIALIGAAIKEFIDWRDDEKLKYNKNTEMRMQFFKRLQDIHLEIMLSRDLMRAHNSAKTWSEQSRILMNIIHKLEEFYMDLEASKELFFEQEIILEGADEIRKYLEKSKDEYIKYHNDVDADWYRKLSLADTFKRCKMIWFEDFFYESNSYKQLYDENLKKAKFAMRKQVYPT